MPNTAYRDVKQSCGSDIRFNTDKISADDKFELFKQFMRDFFNQRKDEFHSLLKEYNLNPFSNFESLPEDAKLDERWKKFVNHKSEFDRYLQTLAREMNQACFNML